MPRIYAQIRTGRPRRSARRPRDPSASFPSPFQSLSLSIPHRLARLVPIASLVSHPPPRSLPLFPLNHRKKKANESQDPTNVSCLMKPSPPPPSPRPPAQDTCELIAAPPVFMPPTSLVTLRFASLPFYLCNDG